MKSTDFIKVMRKIIREEVKSAVREEIQALKPTIKEAYTKPTTKPAQKTAQKPMPNLGGIKGPLADVLKETYMSMQSTNSSEQEEWPDLQGGTYKSEHVTPSNPVSRFNSDPMAGLMKDYSSVLKAAEQHAEGFRS